MTASKGATLPKKSRADDEERRKLESRAILVPAVTHAAVVQTYNQRMSNVELDQGAIRDGIIEKSKAVVSGDMSGSERILVAQATTLNAVCIDLFVRAHSNLVDTTRRMSPF